MVRTTLADAKCPACDHVGLDYHAEQIDLPYLGESLETMIRCAECGYRHVDFILTQMRDPMRHTYLVKDEAAMSVRVVRSSSCTIRIPELGIDIEPGLASDAFITNIEGILVRIERILGQLQHDADDAIVLARVEEMQEVLQLMRDGKAQPVHVVLEDPFGNSILIHDDVVAEPMTQEEASKLKVGMFVIDKDGNPQY